MKPAHLVFAVVLGVLSCLGAMTNAEAGKLYQLEFEYVLSPAPALPCDIELTVYEGDEVKPDKLKGTSFETFVSQDQNGQVEIDPHSCDPVACLTDTRIDANGDLRLEFVVTGYDNATFKSTTSFQVDVCGTISKLEDLHTSCSQPIPIDEPISGDGGGIWTITGGNGECVPGSPDCPPQDDKLFQVDGTFSIPLNGCDPTAVTFNFYKKEDELRGTATADVITGSLTNIVNDDFAVLLNSSISGNQFHVDFESYGSKDDGTFESESSWELIVDPCDSYHTEKIHTSCSQPFYLFEPHPAGQGTVMFTGGCGGCLVVPPVSTQPTSWGELKSLYHE